MEESPAVVPNDGASSEPPGPGAAVVDGVMNDDAAAPEQPVPVVPSPDAAVPGESQTAGTSTGIANTVRATTTVGKGVRENKNYRLQGYLRFFWRYRMLVGYGSTGCL